MAEEKLSLREVRERAERIIFERGGWLTVASQMGMTADALRRKFAPSAPVVLAREALGALERHVADV